MVFGDSLDRRLEVRFLVRGRNNLVVNGERLLIGLLLNRVYWNRATMAIPGLAVPRRPRSYVTINFGDVHQIFACAGRSVSAGSGCHHKPL